MTPAVPSVEDCVLAKKMKRLFAQIVYWTLTLAFLLPVVVIAGVLCALVYERFEQFLEVGAFTLCGILILCGLCWLHIWAKENK